jgi:hypothetical protein
MILLHRFYQFYSLLYIINDISKNGDDSEGFIREAIAEFSPHLEINYIRSSTREEILETFSHYNPSRAILFVRFYQDKFGRLYQNKEIAEMISQLKTPGFVTDTLFIDKGALGGKLVPIERLGEATGDLALKILSNEVSAPYFKTFDEYLYQLSYPRLKEIDLSPMKTTEFFSRFEIINRPLDFFDRHRDLINYVFTQTASCKYGLKVALNSIKSRGRRDYGARYYNSLLFN